MLTKIKEIYFKTLYAYTSFYTLIKIKFLKAFCFYSRYLYYQIYLLARRYPTDQSCATNDQILFLPSRKQFVLTMLIISVPVWSCIWYIKHRIQERSQEPVGRELLFPHNRLRRYVLPTNKTQFNHETMALSPNLQLFNSTAEGDLFNTCFCLKIVNSSVIEKVVFFTHRLYPCHYCT